MEMDRWRAALAEFFMPNPRECLLCGAPLERLGLCEDCQSSYGAYRLRHGQCQRCGSFGFRGKACEVCRDWPGYFKEVRALWPYDEEVRRLIGDYKFRSQTYLVHGLAPLMLPLVPAGATLVPVPVHRRRLAERGYNQSALLARALAKLGGFHYLEGLVRIRHTPHQIGLSRAERLHNLDGAIRPAPALRGHTKGPLVLVDDVLTTGTTLRLCAKALYEGGAREIYGVVIASGMH